MKTTQTAIATATKSRSFARKQGGFSLGEVAITIAAVGILGAVAAPRLFNIVSNIDAGNPVEQMATTISGSIQNYLVASQQAEDWNVIPALKVVGNGATPDESMVLNVAPADFSTYAKCSESLSALITNTVPEYGKSGDKSTMYPVGWSIAASTSPNGCNMRYITQEAFDASGQSAPTADGIIEWHADGTIEVK